MTNRIGICEWSIPAATTRERLALAASVGLTGVEPDLGSLKDGFPLSKLGVQRMYCGWRDEFGLTYPAIAVNALCDHGMADPGARATAFQAIEAAAEAAAALVIPILQLPSFVKGDITSETGFASTVICLRHACECVRGTDIIVGSENALPAEDALRLIMEVGHDNFHIYFDTRNLFAMKGLDTLAILETVMDHICQVHIKDGVDSGPSTLLGEGNSGFAESMAVLNRHGYAGQLLLENDYGRIAQATGEDPADLLRRDRATAENHL